MSDSCWHDLRPYLYPACTQCGRAWTVVDRWGRPGCRPCGINFDAPGMSVDNWNSDIVFPIREYPMSRTCAHCSCNLGTINRKRGQDVVTCQGCGRFVYNASRDETGLPR